MAQFKGHGTFHIRTCQECGNEQSDKVPTPMNDAWLVKKCKVCKSPALDYGSKRTYVNGCEQIPMFED